MDINKLNSIVLEDKFTEIKVLGKGALSIVFFMRELSSKKYFAVKRISNKLFLNKRGQIKILNEINNLTILSHKNIAGINSEFPVLKDNNFTYITMEYCNGKSLLDFLNYIKDDYKRNLNEDELQYIMRQIVDGLIYIKKKTFSIGI